LKTRAKLLFIQGPYTYAFLTKHGAKVPVCKPEVL
jgi:hypothetical protein